MATITASGRTCEHFVAPISLPNGRLAREPSLDALGQHFDGLASGVADQPRQLQPGPSEPEHRLGSNQQRVSRRFYSPSLLPEAHAADQHIRRSRLRPGRPPSAMRPWASGLVHGRDRKNPRTGAVGAVTSTVRPDFRLASPGLAPLAGRRWRWTPVRPGAFAALCVGHVFMEPLISSPENTLAKGVPPEHPKCCLTLVWPDVSRRRPRARCTSSSQRSPCASREFMRGAARRR
jgi:hypothetical protein